MEVSMDFRFIHEMMTINIILLLILGISANFGLPISHTRVEKWRRISSAARPGNWQKSADYVAYKCHQNTWSSGMFPVGNTQRNMKQTIVMAVNGMPPAEGTGSNHNSLVSSTMSYMDWREFINALPTLLSSPTTQRPGRPLPLLKSNNTVTEWHTSGNKSQTTTEPRDVLCINICFTNPYEDYNTSSPATTGTTTTTRTTTKTSTMASTSIPTTKTTQPPPTPPPLLPLPPPPPPPAPTQPAPLPLLFLPPPLPALPLPPPQQQPPTPPTTLPPTLTPTTTTTTSTTTPTTTTTTTRPPPPTTTTACTTTTLPTTSPQSALSRRISIPKSRVKIITITIAITIPEMITEETITIPEMFTEETITTTEMTTEEAIITEMTTEEIITITEMTIEETPVNEQDNSVAEYAAVEYDDNNEILNSFNSSSQETVPTPATDEQQLDYVLTYDELQHAIKEANGPGGSTEDKPPIRDILLALVSTGPKLSSSKLETTAGYTAATSILMPKNFRLIPSRRTAAERSTSSTVINPNSSDAPYRQHSPLTFKIKTSTAKLQLDSTSTVPIANTVRTIPTNSYL